MEANGPEGRIRFDKVAGLLNRAGTGNAVVTDERHLLRSVAGGERRRERRAPHVARSDQRRGAWALGVCILKSVSARTCQFDKTEHHDLHKMQDAGHVVIEFDEAQNLCTLIVGDNFQKSARPFPLPAVL